MIPEIGFLLFLISLLIGIMMALNPIMFQPKLQDYWQIRFSFIQFFVLSISGLILLYSFYVNDFSVKIVAEYSHSTMPWYYRLCALWGNHEGAMFLWVWILASFTVVLARNSAKIIAKIRPNAVAILSIIYCFFGFFMVFTSNPFARLLPEAISGRGLNPLLQDIGMIMHPPMLYLGYVGLSVVFALTISALINNQINKKLAVAIFPYISFAMACLTMGIILGSWWAYRELGWGGWWFWDPVENASLMPWLIGIATLHMLIVLKKTDAWIVWTLILSTLGFVLSLLGTFLVRSGILVSVHSFAQDPNRGMVLLIYLGVCLLGTLFIIQHKTPEPKNKPSRQNNIMVLGSGFVFISMLCILLGTLYPIISQVFLKQTVAVSEGYFNQIVSPLFLIAAILSGLALNKPNGKNLLITLLLAIVQIGIIYYNYYLISLWLILAIITTNWLILNSIKNFNLSKQSFAMVIAHIGFALVIFASGSTSVLSTRLHAHMAIGEIVNFHNYKFQLLDVTKVKEKNFTAEQAKIIVNNNFMLYPQGRIYTDTGMSLAKVAIKINWWQDIYVAIGQKINQNTWAFRIMLKPAIRILWYGGLLIVIGFLLSCYSHRHREKI